MKKTINLNTIEYYADKASEALGKVEMDLEAVIDHLDMEGGDPILSLALKKIFSDIEGAKSSTKVIECEVYCDGLSSNIAVDFDVLTNTFTLDDELDDDSE